MPRPARITFTLPVLSGDPPESVNRFSFRQRVWSVLEHVEFEGKSRENKEDQIVEVYGKVLEKALADVQEWFGDAGVLHYVLELFACINHGDYGDQRPGFLSNKKIPVRSKNHDTDAVVERLLERVFDYVARDSEEDLELSVLQMYENARTSSSKMDFRTRYVLKVVDEILSSPERSSLHGCLGFLAHGLHHFDRKAVLKRCLHKTMQAQRKDVLEFEYATQSVPTTPEENEMVLVEWLATETTSELDASSVHDVVQKLGLWNAGLIDALGMQLDTSDERRYLRENAVNFQLWEAAREDDDYEFVLLLIALCDPACGEYKSARLSREYRNQIPSDTFPVDTFEALLKKAKDSGLELNDRGDELKEVVKSFKIKEFDEIVGAVSRIFKWKSVQTKRAIEHILSVEHDDLTPAKRQKLESMFRAILLE